MSLPACLAVITGSVIVWSSVSGAVAVLIGRAITRADKAQQPTPPDDTKWLDPWPSESPFDLQGFDLDARFYGVLAPSFREYR